MEEDYFEMEMPTPCQACGEIFDLNDGYESEKWYPRTTICASCHEKEEEEIEEDERWRDANYALSEALFDFRDGESWKKLTRENLKSLTLLVDKTEKGLRFNRYFYPDFISWADLFFIESGRIGAIIDSRDAYENFISRNQNGRLLSAQRFKSMLRVYLDMEGYKLHSNPDKNKSLEHFIIQKKESHV